MEKKILIVEDDKDISSMIAEYLEESGYSTDVADSGKDAVRLFGENKYSLLLFDIMLPDKSGIELVGDVRKSSVVPIIMISARGNDFEKSIALGLGADDYVTKPFSLIELGARVKAQIRRSGEYLSEHNNDEKILVYKDISLNIQKMQVLKNEKDIKLTSKEFELLRFFLEHPGFVFTKEKIYDVIWKDAFLGDDNIVNVHISRLRNKLEDDVKNPKYIQTLWGIGYRLEAPDEQKK